MYEPFSAAHCLRLGPFLVERAVIVDDLVFFLRFSTGILKAVPLRKLRELCADVLVAALPVHTGEARAVKILRKEALKLPCRAESAALIKRFQPRRRVRVVGYTRSFHKRARCAVIFADRGEIDVIGKKFRKLPGILRAERAHFPRRRPVKLVHAKRREHFAVFGEIPDLQPPILPQDKIHALPECASVFPLGILRRWRREAEGIERPGRDALERHGKPRLSERQTALRIKGTVRKNIPTLQLVGTVFYIRLHAAAVIQLVSSGQREALGIKLKTVGLRDLPQLCRGLRRRRPVCLAGFAQSVVPLREAPVGFRPGLPLCRGPRPPCGGAFVCFCAAQSVRHNDNAVRSLNGICLILPVQQPGSIGRGSEQQRERRGDKRRFPKLCFGSSSRLFFAELQHLLRFQ